MVIFGEQHAKASIVELQTLITLFMAEKNASREQGTLNVVMEHFSFEMQQLLDDFTSGKISFDELVYGYEAIGTEGHDIKAY